MVMTWLNSLDFETYAKVVCSLASLIEAEYDDDFDARDFRVLH